MELHLLPHSTRAIVETAKRCEDESLANSIKNEFLVDDHLSGAESIEGAHVKVVKLCVMNSRSMVFS